MSALLLTSQTGVSYLIPAQVPEHWQVPGEQQAELTQLVGGADVGGFGAGHSFPGSPRPGAPPFAGHLVVLPVGSLARRPARECQLSHGGRAYATRRDIHARGGGAGEDVRHRVRALTLPRPHNHRRS